MGPIWGRQDPGGPPCWPHELCYLVILAIGASVCLILWIIDMKSPQYFPRILHTILCLIADCCGVVLADYTQCHSVLHVFGYAGIGAISATGATLKASMHLAVSCFTTKSREILKPQDLVSIVLSLWNLTSELPRHLSNFRTIGWDLVIRYLTALWIETLKFHTLE